MKSHRDTCPKCSQSRSRGQNIKCLTVFENGNSFCHHCGYDSSKEGQTVVEYKKPSQVLPQVTSGEFREILTKRGITEDVAKRNKISWNGKEIMFPYIHKGEIVNIKYRGKDKTFRQEAGAMKIFYGLDDIIGEKDIYIVEGEWDKLACEVAGYENVSSVPDGAPTPETKTYTTKFKFIDHCEHLLDAAERVIIAVDNDLPGKTLEAELVRRLDPERCWLVRWPEGCKDANDVLVKHGMVALMTCLENPKQIPIEGVFTVEDFFDDIDALYENGLRGGVSTGWAGMDNYYTIRPGELSIITGIPSHGKSTWLTALMINLTHQFGWKFSIFTPENMPLQRYMGIIASNHVGKPFSRGEHERISKEELQEAKAWMDDHYYFIQPEDNALGIENLIDKAKETVKRYGINALILDPWNEIDHKRPPGMTETEHINASLSKVRRFGRIYQVHTFIVAHPQKMMKNPSGNYPVPTAYDISGSAHWYNKGDAILSIWRDVNDEKKQVEIHVQKIRFREVGRVGKINLNFQIMTGRYSSTGYFESHYKDVTNEA